MKAGLWGVSNRWLQRFWARIDRSGGEQSCWVWRGSGDADGYGRIRFNDHTEQAHRVSWQLENGAIPEGMVVRHKVCDNPPCVNPAHLMLGTKLDNARDAIEKRRHAHGERSGGAKLTEAQAIELREAFRHGASRYELADRYGITHTAVCFIVKGKRWRHLGPVVRPKPRPGVATNKRWQQHMRERIASRKKSPA